MHTRRAGLPALLLAVLLLASCVRVEQAPDAGAPDEVVELDEQPAGDAVVTPPEEGEDLEVSLDIVEGPEGSTLAFVPVTIHGEGPFAFALDTGASNSVLDEGIAADLELEPVGGPRDVTGVTGDAEAALVQIEDWHAEGVDLGTRPVIVLDLSGPEMGAGIQGLLGSDVLSAFGAITVDYDAGVLRLRPRDD